MTTTRRRSRYAVAPDFPRAVPDVEVRYAARILPSPVVVVGGSAMFLCGLVGSAVIVGSYKALEWLTGRRP